MRLGGFGLSVPVSEKSGEIAMGINSQIPDYNNIEGQIFHCAW